METIVNKVTQSGLVTLNLEQFLPNEAAVVGLDIAPFLFKGMILREKDFRAALPETDWSVYEGKQVAVYCSADAIIPMWAYMLLAVYLQQCHATAHHCTPGQLKEKLMLQNIAGLDISPYAEGRVVIKGCGEIPLPESAFLAISERLIPAVKSLMYGEPCSTVPVYKKR